MAASLKRDLEAVDERVARVAADDAAAAGPDIAPLERQGAVEEDFKKTLEGLGRLKRDMPAVVAKMERAKVAGEYAITERR
jgi:kinetochor protein Mis14/NSL1